MASLGGTDEREQPREVGLDSARTGGDPVATGLKLGGDQLRTIRGGAGGGRGAAGCGRPECLGVLDVLVTK